MRIDQLTPLQLQVAARLADFETKKEIARGLSVSHNTVNTVIAELTAVFGLSAPAHLTAFLRPHRERLTAEEASRASADTDADGARLHIYIASPYTLGDTATNVRRQIDAANQLIDAGYVPVWPLSCHYLHEVVERDYETWMVMCFAWLSRCDGVWRLTGDSKGADREVQEAYRLGLPVLFEADGQKWEKKAP